MEIRFCHISIEKFLRKLNTSTLAKVLRTLELLERYGFELSLPHSRALRDGFFELRIKAQQPVRLIYCFSRGEAIILNAFIKKSQHLPPRQLELARKRARDLERS